MEDLSVELGRCIVAQVHDRSDLRSLRLINKRYSLLASEFLFSSVYVRFHEDSLRKLLAISRHETLRYSVTELVYEADGNVRDYWIPPPLAHYLYLVESGDDDTDRDLHLGIVLDEASQLSAAMNSLPNIVHVRFQSLTKSIASPEASSEASQAEGSQADAVLTLPHSLRGHGVRAFFAVMRAATVAGTSLQRLETPRLRFGLHYNFLKMRGLDMQHATNMFARLRHISIYLDTQEGEPGSDLVLSRGGLARLLATATNLESLRLGFDQRPGISISLNKILGSGTWPALHTLYILGLDFHFWEMGEFLRRHPAIRDMGLANCKLYSGTLRDLLESMRDLLNLRAISLDGALGDSNEEYDFLEATQNRQSGCDFVLGRIEYPQFSKTPSDSSGS